MADDTVAMSDLQKRTDVGSSCMKAIDPTKDAAELSAALNAICHIVALHPAAGTLNGYALSVCQKATYLLDRFPLSQLLIYEHGLAEHAWL